MTSSPRAVIVANGEPPSAALLERLLEGAPLLICADGGANAVHRMGWQPDYVVGDLDSVAADVTAALPAERIKLVDADNTGTDLQKALRLAGGLGISAATLTGTTGARLDHVLWNLSLLKVYGADMALEIAEDGFQMRLIHRRARIQASVGQKLSLTPLNGPVLGIRTRGLRFPLRREMLAPGLRDGISNEVVANPVEITLEAGDLLVLLQRDEPTLQAVWVEAD